MDTYSDDTTIELNSISSSGTTSDGLSYNIYDDTYTAITGYSGNSASLVIPQTIEDIPVTTINSSVFKNHTEITTVVLGDNVETIGTSAFYGCKNIQSVTFNSKLKTISGSAFYGCAALTSVSFGNSLVTINNSAFYGCTNLSSVTLNEGLKTLDYNAFYGTAITEISIPSTLTTVNSYSPFNNCESLTKVVFANGIEKIPNNMLKRQSSSSYVYANNIILPDSVKSIGSGAFSGCSNITSVSLPSNLETISDSAFYECTNLSSVTLNEGLKTLGGNAFYGTAITEITIPSTIATVNSYSPFNNCKSLTKVVFANGIEKIPNNMLKRQSSSSYVYASNIIIPDSVKSIGSDAISGCRNITSVSLPSNLETISDSAFYECTNLSSVTLNEGLKTLGGNAFYGTAITEITIPSTLTSVSSYSPFNNCASLSAVTFASGIEEVPDNILRRQSSSSYVYAGSVVLPNSVKTIGSNAFYGCPNITSISLSSSLETINSSAFSTCTGLTSVAFNDNLVTIGSSAFNGCTSLASVSFGSNLKTIDSSAFYNCTSLAAVSLNEGLETINNNSFYGTAITEIKIPSTVKNVYSCSPFNNCKSLSTVKFASGTEIIPNNILGRQSSSSYVYAVSVVLPDSVKTIGSNAFYGCPNITSISLSSSLETINSSAFNACTGLTSVAFNDNLVTIGSSAFNGCTSLASVSFGSNLKTIDSSAFYNCTSLAAVSLNEGLETINNNSFYGTAITEIKIPSTVKNVNSCSPFNNCKSLSTVKFASGTEIIPNNILGRQSSSSYVYAVSVVLPDSVKTIGSNAFYGCPNITSISLSSSLETINSSAFNACTGLTSVAFIDNLVTIGSSAFNGCTSLASVSFGSNLKTIDSSAFYNCTSLAAVSLNEGLETINNNSFYGTAVTEITIPSTVKNVNSCSPFNNCKSLSKVTFASGMEKIPDNILGRYSTSSYVYANSVVLPNSVKYIGNNAFCGCVNLNALEFGLSLESIGSSAFLGCTGLESITFNTGLTSIGASAFNGCISLTSIILSDNIETIGNYAFIGCTNLEGIYFPGNSPSVTAASSSSRSFDTSVTLYYSSFEPSWTDNSSFYDPESGTWNGYNLNLWVQEGIISAGICGSNVRWKLEDNGILTVFGSGDMYNYSLPSNIAPWNDYKNDITSLIIDDGVTSLGNYSFNECTELSEISLNDDVERIGTCAFYDCKGIEGILTIPVSTTYIGNYAFYNCSGITGAVIIPNDVAYIGDSAFTGMACTDFIADSEYYKSVDGILYSADCSELIQCPNGKNGVLILPDGITCIGKGAFCGCSNLTSVVIPDTVLSISNYAFYNCSSLVNITIPHNVLNIGDDAFYGCVGMDNVYFTGEAPAVREAENENPSFVTTAVLNYPSEKQGWIHSDEYDSDAGTWEGYKLDEYNTNDINSDNKLNVSDAVYLLWAISGREDYTIPAYASCDYTGDSYINASDAVYLLWHIFYPDDYPMPGSRPQEEIGTHTASDTVSSVDVYSVSDLIIDLQTNTVSAVVSAPENCALIVRFIDEDIYFSDSYPQNKEYIDENNLYASHVIRAETDLERIDAEINGTLPEYFVVEAILLDGDGEALCNPNTSIYHTQRYETFKNKTIDDFMETESVIMFDENSDSSFGVLADDVLILTADKVTYDENESIYYITDPSDELTIGAKIYICDYNSDYLFMIEDIDYETDCIKIVPSQSDDEEYGLSDFYKFIKVDMMYYGDVITNENYGSEYVLNKDIINEDLSAECAIACNPVEFETDHFRATAKVSGKISASLVMEWDLILFGEDYMKCDFSYSNDFTVTASLEAKWGTENNKELEKYFEDKKEKKELTFGKFRIPFGVTGLDAFADIKASVEWKATAGVELTYNIKTTHGFKYNTKDGYQKIDKKETKCEIDCRGHFEIQFGPRPSIGVEFLDGVVSIDLECFFGVKAEGDAVVPVYKSGTSKHACYLCIDGNVKGVFEVSAKLKYKITDHLKGTPLDLTLVNLEKNLFDFFISLHNDSDSLFGGHIMIGEGSCPNKSYAITFNVFDSDGNPYNANVKITKKGNNTVVANVDSGNYVFLYDGNYLATVNINNKKINKSFTVSKSHQTVTITETSGDGAITGMVKDAENNNAIEGATVKITSGGVNCGSTTTAADGRYTIDLPSGSYKYVISADDYISAKGEVTIGDAEIKYMESTLMAKDDDDKIMGGIFGTITDAANGNTLSDVTIKIYHGADNTSGTEAAINVSLHTDSNGIYSYKKWSVFGVDFGLPAGNYTLVLSKEGYIDTSFNVVIVGGENTEFSESMAPVTSLEEYRVVLTWVENPRDLDSHYTGVTSSGSDHVYYSRKGGITANLDLDDTTSYGPETVYVTGFNSLKNGFVYCVHDYTNRYSDNSTALSNSGATVKVYKGATHIATYYVPTNVGGTVWNVFSISKDGVITPINTMSYESAPSSVGSQYIGSLGTNSLDSTDEEYIVQYSTDLVDLLKDYELAYN